MANDNHREWHKRLFKALWADKTSKKIAICTTPFALTYGHDVVLHVEINVHSLRLERQPGMGEAAYIEAMMQELSQLSVIHARALNHLTVGKQVVAWAYNKKVRLQVRVRARTDPNSDPTRNERIRCNNNQVDKASSQSLSRIRILGPDPEENFSI
ncbi:PREDICTED: retrotransposon [Prunus dulcis]|uniref:PREDICTED: retrotransposon n=1 Tax=Prunus dulcis TaxID=3755 RepID=A0A5E4FS76_PRUDU|nr:PREDICTED: retrotransposon [Prunus dulcis]